MSVEGSLPITLASSESESSLRVTVISSAPATTWALVTMCPSSSMTKPEPLAACPPGGEPKGPCGSAGASERDSMKATPGEACS